MITAADIRAVISLQENLSRQLAPAINSLHQLERTADQAGKGASKAFDGVKASASGMGSVLSGLGAGIGFGALNVAVGAVGAAFGAAKGSVVDLNASLEQSQIAFTTMLGSGEKASAFLSDLQKFAANTPFEFPELVDASKKLLAMGFDSQKVVPMLTAVGDSVAAVGGGKEMIDGVTMALGQMNAKGKVSAEEMGQLAERGIPAWDMLAKKLGVSIPEAMDQVSKGAVKADTFMAAFQEGTAERFGGMMAKQSQTFSGAMSTITDSLSMATASAFKPFFGLLSEGAIALAGFLQSDRFTGWADNVANAIGTVIEVGRDMFELFTGGEGAGLDETLAAFFPADVVENIISIVQNLGHAFRALFEGDIATLAASAGEILNSIGTIIVASVEGWATSFAAWVDGAEGLQGSKLAEMAQGILSWIITAGAAIVDKLGVWGAAFVDWVVPRIPGILEQLGAYLSSMAGWLLGTALPTILGHLATWGAAFVDWVAPRIPPLLAALGGLLVQLGGWIIGTALPAIIGKLVEWGGAFIGWVATDVLPKLPGALLTIQAGIITWISGAVAALTAKAAELGQGIIDGITGAIGRGVESIRSAAATAAQSALSSAKAALGIESPSKVFWKEVGQPIVDGVIGGIASREKALMKATTDTIAPAAAAAAGMAASVEQTAIAMAEAVRQQVTATASGLQSFGDFANRFAGNLAQVFGHGKFTEIDLPIFGPWPSIGKLPDSVFKPRALGGPGFMGVPYLVGERGPELYVPSSNGMFLSADVTNAMLSGASGGVAGGIGGSGGYGIYVAPGALVVQGNLVHERELPGFVTQMLMQGLRQ